MARAVFVPVGFNSCDPEKVLGAERHSQGNVPLK